MADLIPSGKEVGKFTKMATGAIIGEVGSKMLKENSSMIPIVGGFISQYPIISDVIFMIGGIFVSKMKGFSEIGSGMAVTGTANAIMEGASMLGINFNKTATAPKTEETQS